LIKIYGTVILLAVLYGFGTLPLTVRKNEGEGILGHCAEKGDGSKRKSSQEALVPGVCWVVKLKRGRSIN
jgi:hypothetical protein